MSKHSVSLIVIMLFNFYFFKYAVVAFFSLKNKTYINPHIVL